MSQASHHLKAYIVFLIASILFVGLLAYLYTPFNFDTSKYLNSQAIISSEVQISQEVLVTETIDPDTTTAKRMRYTTLLLRYQKELHDLESQTTSSSSEVVEKIQYLRSKIENIEKIIQELTQ
jgi:cytochrome c oxidase assembly factor CtaG